MGWPVLPTAEAQGSSLTPLTAECDLICASGVTGRFASGLGDRLCLLLVKSTEIDRVEQQWRETAIADRVSQYAASEGEDQARRFCQHERLKLFVRHIAHAE